MATCWKDCCSSSPDGEVCNGKDDNCNGLIDEEAQKLASGNCPATYQLFFMDDDGDGHGNPADSACLCTATGKYTATVADDCDDSDSTVHPGAKEVCNGKDDDCDGGIDDGLGEISCGKGVCAHSIPKCAGGTLQTCDPMEGASPEACNGLDDDCDGVADDGLGTATCGMGVCTHAVPNCDGGVPRSCDPMEGASPEACNGLDDDCDGVADDGLGTTTCGTGVCTHTVQNCMNGVKVECDPMEGATSEVCNDLDDDCNGLTDESLTHPCYDGIPGTEGTGPCHGGSSTCDAGVWGACVGEVVPSPEVCNGLDDDCDGKTDAEDPDLNLADCEVQKGVCAGSKKLAGMCVAGAWQTCTDTSYGKWSVDYQPGFETTCDGLDNDCDGQTDEDFSVTGRDGTTYKGIGLNCGVGECSGGKTICRADKSGIDCTTFGNSSTEMCNGLDDDCDDATDEEGAADCIEYYVDADGDGYGAGTPRCLCAKSPPYSNTSGNDCCDLDPSAHPYQQAWFTVADACGSFDYNCDGNSETRYGRTGSCNQDWPNCSVNTGFTDFVACGQTSGAWLLNCTSPHLTFRCAANQYAGMQQACR